jgi:hypothetical protein
VHVFARTSPLWTPPEGFNSLQKGEVYHFLLSDGVNVNTLRRNMKV